MTAIRWWICSRCARRFTETDAPRITRVRQCPACGGLDATEDARQVFLGSTAFNSP